MKQKVLLGLSGGVDSAVAAVLLKEQGYEVIGAFMKNFSENKSKLTGECNWVADKKDAQKVAAKLGIPFITLDFETQYTKYVITPMFHAYKQGLTPNPDSLCNRIIKFPLLWKAAKQHQCDFIATGHYIKKKYNKKTNTYSLHLPKDKTKDQSYFLYELMQSDLKHTLFPIADLTKTEVRAIAHKHDLHNYNKKGTRGICFVGKVDLKDFLKQKIKSKQGSIVNEHGEIIGTHEGVVYFTIGERIGDKHTSIFKEYRNATHQKLFIAQKILKKNTLVVVPKKHPLLFTNKFTICAMHSITSKKIPKKVSIRIRHLAPLVSATLTKKGNTYVCIPKKPIEALASGQSCVIYKGTEVLGGGEIRT